MEETKVHSFSSAVILKKIEKLPSIILENLSSHGMKTEEDPKDYFLLRWRVRYLLN